MNFANLVADLIPEYIERREKDLQLLRDSLQSGDFEAIRRIAHQTKGHAANYGFPELGVVAAEMEVHANEKNMAGVSECVQRWADWQKSAVVPVK